MTDSSSILNIIRKTKPNEIYNLAAQSHVKVSFELPVFSTQINSIGTLNCLEAIRQTLLVEKVKFYQASTSELYGEVLQSQQSEETPFNISNSPLVYASSVFLEGSSKILSVLGR